MRIITGKAKGVRLFSPTGDFVRPTTEMTKEGVFSAIQFDIQGKEFLDLFSGSGQMGLEAVSRGAKSATMVDARESSIDIIRKNAEKTKLAENCHIIRSEYGEFIKSCEKRGKKFDYVFADPPYEKDLTGELCKRMIRAGMINPGGIIMVETANADFDEASLAENIKENIKKIKQYKFSKCYVYFIFIKDEEDE